jgi:hypothetical protein
MVRIARGREHSAAFSRREIPTAAVGRAAVDARRARVGFHLIADGDGERWSNGRVIPNGGSVPAEPGCARRGPPKRGLTSLCGKALDVSPA